MLPHLEAFHASPMLLLPLHTLHCLSNVALVRFHLITHPFTHPFVYTSVHPFINLPIHPPIYISMHMSIYSLTFQPIHLSTHRAIQYPLIYLSAHPPPTAMHWLPLYARWEYCTISHQSSWTLWIFLDISVLPLSSTVYIKEGISAKD